MHSEHTGLQRGHEDEVVIVTGTNNKERTQCGIGSRLDRGQAGRSRAPGSGRTECWSWTHATTCKQRQTHNVTGAGLLESFISAQSWSHKQRLRVTNSAHKSSIVSVS